jgi:hypothetical protein
MRTRLMKKTVVALKRIGILNVGLEGFKDPK